MKSSEQGREIKQSGMAQPEVFPAVLTCAAGVLGLLMTVAQLAVL